MQFLIISVYCMLISGLEGRAYGQRVEYRYEYDPKRDIHPRIHVKFDDVTDETELMRIFNHRKPMEVRKSPSRYADYSSMRPRFYDEEDTYLVPYEDMDQGNRNRGWRNDVSGENQMWHRGFENLPIEKFASGHENIAEEMAKFLRQQSESILSSHFPNIPRSHFSDPSNYKIPSFFHRFFY